MAKYIKVTGANSNPVYIPSKDVMKIVASDDANNCIITYIGGGTITGAIVLAESSDSRALEASLFKSLLSCINAGPDAAGFVTNTTVFTAVS